MDNRGFTLTELLVVVAIIGILAAIAVPAYLGAQGRAKQTSAKELSQSLASAMEVYYQERNNYGPDGTISGNTILSTYPSFKPSNDIIFDLEIDINNNGQNFTIKAKPKTGQSFPRDLTELQLDNNNNFTWIK